MGKFLSNKEFVKRTGQLVYGLREEYGLPYSSCLIMNKLGDVWLKDFDGSDFDSVNFMRYRFSQYVKKFGLVEDLLDKEFKRNMRNRLKVLGYNSLPMSIFLGVNKKQRISELNLEELESLDACKLFFINCSDDELEMFVREVQNHEDLCGVEQINLILGKDLDKRKVGTKFFSVDCDRVISYGKNDW